VLPSRMWSALVVLNFLAGVSAHRNGLVSQEAARQSALELEWAKNLNFEDDGDRNGKSPVQRVVGLLQKMKSELEAEAGKDSELYDKQVCWCETNEKEKTKSLADAEAKIEDLMAEIEGRSAGFGKAATEIEALKMQISRDSEALKTATAIREKAAAEFSDEEKDLIQTVTNLRNAIAVLAKHNGGSMLQLDAPLVSGLRVLLRDAALKREEWFAGHPNWHQQQQQPAFLAMRGSSHRSADQAVESALLSATDADGAPVMDSIPVEFAERVVAERARATGAFVQQPRDAAYKSYSGRSSEIYGVLTQMMEEFEAELSQAQKDEMKAAADFEALAMAKKKQIAVAKDKLDAMEGEHAANIKALSDAKEDIALTREQRSADVEFLRNLKVTCSELDTEWERRSATRSAEITAVAETIAILTEDDNREALAKTSFLQETFSSNVAARRSQAAESLRRAAQAPEFQADDLLAAWHGRRSEGPSLAAGPRARLSTLATAVQLDSFTKVKQMMDEMVAQLKKQQQEEVDFKAYCIKEFDENEKAVFAKTEEKKDLEAQIESLEALGEKLAKEIKDAKEQISATEVEIKKAGEAREAENAEFQTTVADQRATQTILKKALTRLEDFYKKGKGNKLVLTQQEPPVKFNKYKDHAGASPVMGLIEQIIEDSKKVESEATSSEYKAQAEYESFVKDSTAIVKQLGEAIVVKTKASATAESDLASAKGDHEAAVAELESWAAYKADLHGQCDFVLKNFDIRQSARLQEIESIQAAKAILSGAS